MMNNKIIEDLQKIESSTPSEDQFRLAQSRKLALQNLESKKLSLATPCLLLLCCTLYLNFYIGPEKEFEQTSMQLSDNQVVTDEIDSNDSPFYYWLDIYDQF